MALRDQLPTKHEFATALAAGFVVGLIGEMDPPAVCFANALLLLPALLAVLAWRQRAWWGGPLLSLAAVSAFAVARSINIGLGVRLLPISVPEDPAFTVADDAIAMLVYAAMLATVTLVVRLVGRAVLRAKRRWVGTFDLG